jgi:hypothetical protein
VPGGARAKLDPDHYFPGVNLQLFDGTPGPPATPSRQGFITARRSARSA